MGLIKSKIINRKDDHIRINLTEDVQSGLTNGLENIRFEHNAMPEINFKEIQLEKIIFGKRLEAPILISSMTGGVERAKQINHVLAMAAQNTGIALALGSQRSALELKEMETTFKIRKTAPDILLFANLGAVQLNYEKDYIGYCQRAIEMVEADALYLHLNPLQEALQPEGDTQYQGLIEKINDVIKKISIPLLIKEVGWGISETVAKQLIQAGVQGIDVAGAGGTSWSQVEMYRIEDENKRRVAGSFKNWGITTAESIVNVRKVSQKCMVIASGGIRNGLDIAKSIRLGADMAGMAGPFLKAALKSEEETIRLIDEMKHGLKISMFVTGSKDLSQLAKAKLL